MTGRQRALGVMLTGGARRVRRKDEWGEVTVLTRVGDLILVLDGSCRHLRDRPANHVASARVRVPRASPLVLRGGSGMGRTVGWGGGRVSSKIRDVADASGPGRGTETGFREDAEGGSPGEATRRGVRARASADETGHRAVSRREHWRVDGLMEGTNFLPSQAKKYIDKVRYEPLSAHTRTRIDPARCSPSRPPPRRW